ncbi:MAG: methyltransferase domain-containing protein [Chloroflexi bacterium]|nr:methyltransferase domain-containing protein [Chloroflexota bacterium]
MNMAQYSSASYLAMDSGFDPGSILDMNYAFARTAMLVAAVRLRLFTHLAERSMSAVTLSAIAETEPDVTQRLLSGLRTLGLVEQEGDTYRLAPIASHFLVEGKPSYLGGDTLATMEYLPAWFTLPHTVRTGKPYRDLGQPSVAEAFFAAHVRDLFTVVYPIAKQLVGALHLRERESCLQVLDVGAGSGAWSAAFAQQYPNAVVTAIDLPTVAAQGRQQTAELGLSNRFTWVEADITTLPLDYASYDLVIVAHLCRFLGEQRSRELLERLAVCCVPDATIVIAEVLLLDDRSGPPLALTLDLSLAVNTSQGRLFTFQELRTWLHESGFQEAIRLDVAGPSSVIVTQKGSS